MEKLLLKLKAGKGNAGTYSALMVLIFLSLNLSGQKPQTTLIELWENGAWKNSQKITYSYDGNQYETSKLVQTWNPLSTSWINSVQTIHTNNPIGTINNSVTRSWDDQNNIWEETAYKTTYTYNAANKVLTSVSEYGSGTVWLNLSRISHTYNGSGNVTNTLIESWNPISSSWNNTSQSNSTYNPNGTLNQVVTQSWNPGTTTWDYSRRSTSTYNASGKLSTMLDEVWSSGSWLNESLSTNTYSVNGSLSKLLSQSWVVPSGPWVNLEQSDFSYNQEGSQHQIVNQDWEPISSVWVNAERITYTYGTSTGRVEIKDEKSISVYPNPADDFITIRSDFNFNSSKYSLEDQAGKQVRTGRLTDRITTLDISGLADGLYILRVGDTRQHIFKIIKK